MIQLTNAVHLLTVARLRFHQPLKPMWMGVFASTAHLTAQIQGHFRIHFPNKQDNPDLSSNNKLTDSNLQHNHQDSDHNHHNRHNLRSKHNPESQLEQDHRRCQSARETISKCRIVNAHLHHEHDPLPVHLLHFSDSSVIRCISLNHLSKRRKAHL